MSAAEEVESADEEVENAAAGVWGGPALVKRAVTGVGRAAATVVVSAAVGVGIFTSGVENEAGGVGSAVDSNNVNNNNSLTTMPTSKLDLMDRKINDIKLLMIA